MKLLPRCLRDTHCLRVGRVLVFESIWRCRRRLFATRSLAGDNLERNTSSAIKQNLDKLFTKRLIDKYQIKMCLLFKFRRELQVEKK